MTPSTGSSWGSPADYAEVLKAGSEGASSAIKTNTASINSRKEAKEAKRRTLAALLNNALKRGQKSHLQGKEYSDDMTDFQAQQMQHAARNFVSALQGSTKKK